MAEPTEQDARLPQLLAPLYPVAAEQLAWRGGTLPLRLSGYVAPPAHQASGSYPQGCPVI